MRRIPSVIAPLRLAARRGVFLAGLVAATLATTACAAAPAGAKAGRAAGAADSAHAPDGTDAGLPDGAAPSPRGAITVTDDQGRDVTLAQPAERVITLAPHATELVYAAGAGDAMAGTILGSNFPEAARQVPSIGDGTQPNVERVAELRPDLVIAWLPGATESLMPTLKTLGVPVFYSDPRRLAAIPDEVETLGRLFGTEAAAAKEAASLRARLATLAERYRGRPLVRVFIQAGSKPLYTLNKHSIVNDAIGICGGVNVFADAPATAPQVGLEAVMAARPDAVVAGVGGIEDLRALASAWKETRLPAALAGHVYGVDADLLYRPGPRLVDAAEALCKVLDQARPPASR
ncbi:cobalamin-binding protein [Achromobacter aloeverae]|uniref:Cobalamin-binding protein n=1 Tax=Achromobacter aloeverae TaxID=1750518 RepID=A0A4Q1HEH4_9BURK|nr:cobalamin-binding protein [Achromobacter aloeverae]RXN84652.1 cobalamin-binding protein [Achromobacter aloeverae]